MFDAGDDWLKDVSFVVKNVSKKKITYLEVGCALAHPGILSAIEVFRQTESVRRERGCYLTCLHFNLLDVGLPSSPIWRVCFCNEEDDGKRAFG